MTLKTYLTGAVAGVALLGGAQAALADAHGGEITVAYFLEWPMPFQFAKVNGMFDEAMGVKVNWVAFDTGTAMSAAMASGDVQMAVSQGVPPFVVATSAGQDLQIIDVAVSYSDNDNCVVRSDLEVDKTNAGEVLPGTTVAVPLGTAAHYGFLRQMSHFGVDLASLTIVDMAPPDGAAALAQGSVEMMCGFGAAITRAQEFGNIILTGAEKQELGILVFDVTSAPGQLCRREPRSGGRLPQGHRRHERRVERRLDGRGDDPGDRAGCGHGRAGDPRFHGNLRVPLRGRATVPRMAGRCRAGVHEGRGGRVRRGRVDPGSARKL
jgi:taurine transport system substrate-binding protein